jgi:hypothetical protein
LIDSENISARKLPKDAQYQDSGDGLLLIFARAKKILIFYLQELCSSREKGMDRKRLANLRISGK